MQYKQELANTYGKKHLNEELFKRGVITQALYEAAAEKIMLDIDRLEELCYNKIIPFK